VTSPTLHSEKHNVTSVSDDQLSCSFCGKSKRDVRKLIAGPAVFICDECIELCSGILDEDSATSSPSSRSLMAGLSMRLKALRKGAYHRYEKLSQTGLQLVFWVMFATILVLQVIAVVLLVARR
jgi:hypothetical protein